MNTQTHDDLVWYAGLCAGGAGAEEDADTPGEAVLDGVADKHFHGSNWFNALRSAFVTLPDALVRHRKTLGRWWSWCTTHTSTSRSCSR